jgi:hypothetical protein
VEWGILLIVLLGVLLGFLVLQATFASRHWDRVIAEGNRGALAEAIDDALDGWRDARPPKGTPPADSQALQSVTLVGADNRRCRVSLLAGADVRVADNKRREAGTPVDVGRRAAVTMAERLLYEIPHVRFDEVQVDVYGPAENGGGSGAGTQHCLLTTRVTRDAAYNSEWDEAEPHEILASWRTRQADDGSIDPDDGALIIAARLESTPESSPGGVS